VIDLYHDLYEGLPLARLALIAWIRRLISPPNAHPLWLAYGSFLCIRS